MPFKSIIDAIEEVAEDLVDAIEEAGDRARDASEQAQAAIEGHAANAGLEDTRWTDASTLTGRLFGVSAQWHETSRKPKHGSRRYQAHAIYTFMPPVAAGFQIRSPNIFDHINAAFGGEPVADNDTLVGENDIARFMLSDPITEAIEALRAQGYVKVANGKLTIARDGRLVDAAEGLVSSVALAELVAARWLDRVAGISELGLQPGKKQGHWLGEVNGAPIEIIESRSKTAYLTEVRATLAVPLPDGTTINRKNKKKAKHKSKRSGKLGDRVLDQALVAASSDMDALSARLRTDAVRGPLLEIVHGHRSSTVTATEIVLRRKGPIVDDSGALVVSALWNALHSLG